MGSISLGLCGPQSSKDTLVQLNEVRPVLVRWDGRQIPQKLVLPLPNVQCLRGEIQFIMVKSRIDVCDRVLAWYDAMPSWLHQHTLRMTDLKDHFQRRSQPQGPAGQGSAYVA